MKAGAAVPSACLIIAMAAVVLTLAEPVHAGTTGRLSGFVVDGEGVPLPGVAVSASSPNQIGGVQTTQTDAEGWFQYPRLSPGYFTVRLELDGFHTQELTEVQVRLERMAQVRVVLPLARYGDEITVTETTPVVDPQRVSTGQSFTNDFIQEAAVGLGVRYSHIQLILQAAGTGSTFPAGESGFYFTQSVLGSTGSENVFLIDGLDATSPSWGGPQVGYPTLAIQEVAFESGGFQAEFGRATGGVINALTKSGSNAWSGAVDIRYTDNNLETSGDHYNPDEQTSSTSIAGVTLGGRLVRDRAWFFGSLESHDYRWTWLDSPTTERQASTPAFIKITGQAAPNWLVQAKYLRTPFESTNAGSGTFTAAEATGRWERPYTLFQAEVSGVLARSLLWEMHIGSDWVDDELGPMSGDNSLIQHYNLDTGLITGNYLTLRSTGIRRDQVGTDFTWFVDEALGSHDIKVGGEIHQTSQDRNTCWTGIQGGGLCRQGEEGYQYGDLSASGTSIPYLMQALSPSGPYETTGSITDLFVQDSWRVRPDVTLQLGLRWDRAIYDNDIGQEVADLQMLQPRLGVTWDLTRNGRNLLRASGGRFMHSSFLQLPRAAITAVETGRIWGSCTTIVGVTDPEVCAAVGASQGLEWRFDPNHWDPAGWLLFNTVGSEPSVIASDLTPQYVDTFIIGFERELLRRTSLELSYVDKATRDVFDDTCVENYPTPTTGTSCTGFIIANLPQARRDYTGWLLSFESRALDRLHVLASYTNSNSEGSTHSNIASTDFDLYPYHFTNRDGYLGYHRKHRLKASGYVFLPLDFGIGFNGVWGSPFRWTPVRPAATVDPGAWGNILVEPRGSREGDEWGQLDVQLSKDFNLGRTRLRLIGTVLNLFDSENATDICGRVSGCGEYEQGDATEWQLPRRYELGLRVEF